MDMKSGSRTAVYQFLGEAGRQRRRRTDIRARRRRRRRRQLYKRIAMVAAVGICGLAVAGIVSGMDSPSTEKPDAVMDAGSGNLPEVSVQEYQEVQTRGY